MARKVHRQAQAVWEDGAEQSQDELDEELVEVMGDVETVEELRERTSD